MVGGPLRYSQMYFCTFVKRNKNETIIIVFAGRQAETKLTEALTERPSPFTPALLFCLFNSFDSLLGHAEGGEDRFLKGVNASHCRYKW